MQLMEITTIILNEPTNVIIMVDCAIIEDDNTQWAWKWIELGDLDRMNNS